MCAARYGPPRARSTHLPGGDGFPGGIIKPRRGMKPPSPFTPGGILQGIVQRTDRSDWSVPVTNYTLMVHCALMVDKTAGQSTFDDLSEGEHVVFLQSSVVATELMKAFGPAANPDDATHHMLRRHGLPYGTHVRSLPAFNQLLYSDYGRTMFGGMKHAAAFMMLFKLWGVQERFFTQGEKIATELVTNFRIDGLAKVPNYWAYTGEPLQKGDRLHFVAIRLIYDPVFENARRMDLARASLPALDFSTASNKTIGGWTALAVTKDKDTPSRLPSRTYRSGKSGATKAIDLNWNGFAAPRETDDAWMDRLELHIKALTSQSNLTLKQHENIEYMIGAFNALRKKKGGKRPRDVGEKEHKPGDREGKRTDKPVVTDLTSLSFATGGDIAKSSVEPPPASKKSRTRSRSPPRPAVPDGTSTYWQIFPVACRAGCEPPVSDYNGAGWTGVSMYFGVVNDLTGAHQDVSANQANALKACFPVLQGGEAWRPAASKLPHVHVFMNTR